MLVKIFTDGSARGNPDGPGGYGTILQYVDGKGTLHERTYSQYLINAFNQHWIDGWIKKGWKRGKSEPVKNTDLWKRLLAAAQPHTIRYIWVKGHAGHPDNERCDQLATTAADGDDLLKDIIREG